MALPHSEHVPPCVESSALLSFSLRCNLFGSISLNKTACVAAGIHCPVYVSPKCSKNLCVAVILSLSTCEITQSPSAVLTVRRRSSTPLWSRDILGIIPAECSMHRSPARPCEYQRPGLTPSYCPSMITGVFRILLGSSFAFGGRTGLGFICWHQRADS